VERRDFLRVAGLSLAALVLGTAEQKGTALEQGSPKPNVVKIMADDMPLQSNSR
jgi:hypothetical protein